MGQEFNWGAARKDALTFLDGEFPFVIEEVAVKQTAAAGKTMFAMKVTVESGVFAGRTMKHNITVSPESPVAMRIFYSDMEILGLSAAFFDNPQLNTAAGPEMIAQALTGKRFIGVCKPRMWLDRQQDNIDSIKAAGKRPAGPGMGVAVASPGGLPTASQATPQPSSSTPSATPQPSATPTPSMPAAVSNTMPSPAVGAVIGMAAADIPPPPTAPGEMEPAF
jgi:hypothetical protein